MHPIQTSLEGQEVTLVCVHWRTFPPFSAFAEEDVEVMRAAKTLPENRYAQHKVWLKACGRITMDAAHCLTCPHVRRPEIRKGLPVLVMMDGTRAVPVVDGTTLDTRPLHRGHIVQAFLATRGISPKKG